MIENIPISAGINDTPSYKSINPKSYLVIPVMGSVPIRAMISPIRPEIIPRVSPPDATETTPVSPMIASKKYSGGPNFSAKSASIGAIASKTITENVPPTKLATTETLSAKPPFPCFVRG